MTEPLWVWRRDQRLRRLGFQNYDAYLKSDRWTATRYRYRASDLPQDCVLCEGDGRTLLHHRTYERVGEEELTDLAPLCFACHSLVHGLEREGQIEGLADYERLVNQERAQTYARTRLQVPPKPPNTFAIEKLAFKMERRGPRWRNKILVDTLKRVLAAKQCQP